ncbi:MAG: RNA 2',3'-cyclic phosphodiesterase [Pirellulales bacterium]|nr:RNA 2',3'-cyclic phosphodiesterase [Pirellulales bacterium]
MNPLRTFIAVEISPEIRSSAHRLIERLRVSQAKVKWIETDNLHFTLKFLGDVAAEKINDVCRAVDAAASPIMPFELIVRGCGAFPSPSRPRTVWLGADEGAEPMELLVQAIEQLLEPLGFPREHRRFTPHLTLGRVREGPATGLHQLTELIAKHGDFDVGSMIVDEVTVFSSTLSRGGSKYEALARIELRGE